MNVVINFLMVVYRCFNGWFWSLERFRVLLDYLVIGIIVEYRLFLLVVEIGFIVCVVFDLFLGNLKFDEVWLDLVLFREVFLLVDCIGENWSFML